MGVLVLFDSRDAAQLFTSQAINKIAQGDLSLLHSVLDEYITPKHMPVKISEIFDLTFQKYSKDYKSEYVFKNIIAQKIFLKNHKNNSSVMLSELRVGSNKADCVIVNGHTVCYEIKTEFDTLKRLPEQISTYLKVFEKVNVICSENHIANVISLVPENVGIFKLTDKNALKEVRKAICNYSDIDRLLMISSLRKSEYVFIAEQLTNKQLTATNMHIFSECLDIFNQARSEDLRRLYRSALKKYRKNNINIINDLPPSLTNSAISFKLSNLQQQSLRKVLSQYIYKDDLCTSHL
ncbi:sce7726 family protein [Enterobacter bugandensis]|uniref:sce7726 family protein n=1 Tax=Enterobacter bugandensis TaxID=881260 RepID=UPI002006093E|nr:sce7726 family protein [Enterobacter bugandensis]MCK6735511.1 sce7726 family protein [Enterobacter bugandensis]